MRWAVICFYGAALSVCGLHFSDWRYWLLLLLTVAYGAAVGMDTGTSATRGKAV